MPDPVEVEVVIRLKRSRVSSTDLDIVGNVVVVGKCNVNLSAMYLTGKHEMYCGGNVSDWRGFRK